MTIILRHYMLRLCALLALVILVPAAQAQEFPKLTGRVVDAANLLDPAREAALTEKLATLETQSGRQLVVATIPDLKGYDIADYGYQLGRAWGIGQKGKDDGALLIVAPAERKVRIEAGYGLEGILTDAMSSRIIRNSIVPKFKANDYPGGIEAGADALATLLALPPDEARAQALAAAKAEKQSSNRGGNGFMLIFWIVIIIFFVLPNIFGRRGGRRYRGGSGPVVLWGPGLGGSSWGDSGGGSSWGGGGGGGFSGGGGSFGGGGASGDW